MLEDFLYPAAALIVLTNPLAELPVFLGIVAGRSRRQVHKAAWEVAAGVWVILLGSALGGLAVLDLFGIELPAFRAAGGLVLIVMGMEMALGRDPALQRVSRTVDDPEDALWVPLIMPMLAGPGAIVTTVSLSIRDTHHLGWVPLATCLAVTASALVILVVLAGAGFLARHISLRAQKILTAFSGMILVAIGFQMGLTGVSTYFQP